MRPKTESPTIIAMPASIEIIPSSMSLPRQLAERLLTGSASDFSRSGVIMASHRLLDYLRLELAHRSHACLAPNLFTLPAFLPATLRTGARRISETEKNIILRNLLRVRRHQHLRQGMEADLGRFFDELASEGVAEKAFPALRDLLQEDQFREERHLQRLLDLFAELENLYGAYRDFLQQHHLTDEAHQFAHQVRHIDTHELAARLNRFERLFVAGFADATAVQVALLRRLAADQRVTFLFHADEEALRSHSDDRQQVFGPLRQMIERLGLALPPASDTAIGANQAVARRAFRLPAQPAMLTQAAITVHSSASPLQEVKAAAALVRQMLQQGTPAHEIIVVVPDESRYGRLLASVFAAAAIPSSDSLGVLFAQTRTGQWLRLLLDLAMFDWRLRDVLSVFGNPLMAGWLEEQLGADGAVGIQEAMQRFIETADPGPGAAVIAAALQASHDSKRKPEPVVVDFVRALQSVLSPLDRRAKLPLPAWGERIATLQAKMRLPAAVAADGDDLEIAGLQYMQAALEQLAATGGLLDETFSFADFYRILTQHIFPVRLRVPSQPHRGVQIMGVLEARSIPAPVLILLGNIEGSFPRSIDRQLFVDEPFRHALGLTTHRKREQLQDQHFFSLIAGASAAHLFYSRREAEIPTVKSRYLQRLELLHQQGSAGIGWREADSLLLPGDFIAEPETRRATPALSARFHALRAENTARNLTHQGHFPGARLPLFVHMTAYAMEALLHCPYRYLLKTLNFANTDVIDTEIDGRQLGIWLHRVCEYFFTGLPDPPPGHFDLGQRWQQPITPENRDLALERLRRLSRVLLGKSRARLDVLYQMYYIGWPRFLERELQRRVAGDSKYEYRIEHTGRNRISAASLDIEIDGRIDRLMAAEQEVRIIDYKLRRLPAKTPVQQGLSPQLPLYVRIMREQADYAGSAFWAAEYFALWDGKLLEFSDEAGDAELKTAWQLLAEKLEKRLQQHCHDAEPLAPEEDQETCSYCEYAGICRRQEVFGRPAARGEAATDS